MLKRPSSQPHVGRSASRKVFIMALDALLFAGALLFSFAVRFDMTIPHEWERYVWLYGAFSIAVRLFVFWWFRLYDISFRFVSLRDLWALGKASLISTVINVAWGVLGIPWLLWSGGSALLPSRVPLPVLALDALFTVMCGGGLRVAKRIYLDLVVPGRSEKSHIPKTIIVGAGDAADQLLRYLARNNSDLFHPVGLLDDDPHKKGVLVQGVPVIGTLADLASMVKMTDAVRVLVAIPSAAPAVLRQVYTDAQRAGVQQIRILSSQLVSGPDHFDVNVKNIREIRIEDLLGRPPVEIDIDEICRYLKGARVLITGASGSIGSEIVRQVTRYKPDAIAVVDMDETGLFNLELGLADMRLREGMQIEPETCLVDIRNEQRLRELFAAFRPTVVFHAAAYKHVPMMEKHPEEAVQTNIFGTWKTARLADEFGVERFIFISTDKSVNPRNVMGASKRVAGMICGGLQKKSKTRFVTVRFGNVLGSRGSVIPIFLEQLRNGGPLTVTHPDMERYFMTIPEAVSLVLEAGAIGEGGEIFVLDMGEPVRIMTLAEEIIRMHGKVPHKDIRIEISGMRPGEKLYEELLTEEEGTSETRYEKLSVAHLSERDASHAPEDIIAAFATVLASPAGIARKQAIVAQLQRWVPSFQPDQHEINSGINAVVTPDLHS